MDEVCFSDGGINLCECRASLPELPEKPTWCVRDSATSNYWWISLIVLGILLSLLVVFIILYRCWRWFRENMDILWRRIQDFFRWLWQGFQAFIRWVIEILHNIWERLHALFCSGREDGNVVPAENVEADENRSQPPTDASEIPLEDKKTTKPPDVESSVESSPLMGHSEEGKESIQSKGEDRSIDDNV